MNDLECPYCPREFTNRFNRDEHTAACHKRHKSNLGQQKIGKFFSFAPASAPAVQAVHCMATHYLQKHPHQPQPGPAVKEGSKEAKHMLKLAKRVQLP
jgi:hypothetical protein